MKWSPGSVVLVAILVLSLTVSSAMGQTFPPKFKGELNVCEKVNTAVKQDKTPEEALIAVFLFYSQQPSDVYESIQRSIVDVAVNGCLMDGVIVINAAVRVGMKLPLLILSLAESGVSKEIVKEVLLQAGVDPLAIEDAIEVARHEIREMSPVQAPVSSLPSEFSTDPGQASPFAP